MHWLNLNDIYPSCTTSLKELFEKLCGDRTIRVTGEPGCTKSFNVILLSLFFHRHGHDDPLSGLLCNQKTHAQAAYENVQKAMRFHSLVTGAEAPSEDPSQWLFLMVAGDDVLGNNDFPNLKLVINTAATGDDTGSVGMLMPLMATLISDERHENNLLGMLRNIVVQHGVDLGPYLAECDAIDGKGMLLRKLESRVVIGDDTTDRGGVGDLG